MDACLRKEAVDMPSIVSQHYAGKALGPVKPFGFTMGNFSEESEFLKFSTPETAAARAQVLDYFLNMRKVVRDDHLMFRFDESMEVSYGDKLFIDHICVQMGFHRGLEKEYIIGLNRNVLDHYPELGYFRDLIFMFKLTMVPTSDKLPELKPWTPEQAALAWNIENIGDPGPEQINNYLVAGFSRRLDCIQVNEKSLREQHEEQHVKGRGLFDKIMRLFGAAMAKARSSPSAANPSILLTPVDRGRHLPRPPVA